MAREVFVFIDLRGERIPVGRLWTRIRRGRESVSFEYDAGWQKHAERFALEPALTLTPGPFHSVPGKALCNTRGTRAATQAWRRATQRSTRNALSRPRQYVNDPVGRSQEASA